MAKGTDGHVYVFADDSKGGTPSEWIDRAVSSYERHRSDGGIYEQNRLGEDNASLLQERARRLRQSWKPVTARGTKRQRAEPVAAEYLAGKVHHVGNDLTELEEEMCGWDPNESEATASPNRIDALVHGVKELLLSEEGRRRPLAIR